MKTKLHVDEMKNLRENLLPRTGGLLSGDLQFNTSLNGVKWHMNTDGAEIFLKNDSDGDTDSYLCFRTFDNGNEYFKWDHRTNAGTTEYMTLKGDGLRVKGNLVYHTGNKPSAADIGASPSNHGHSASDVGAAASNHGHYLWDITPEAFSGGQDLNTWNPHRSWICRTSSTSSNRPSDYFTVANFGANGSSNGQLAWNYDNRELDLRFRKRHDTSGTYSAWRTIYHSGNFDPNNIVRNNGTVNTLYANDWLRAKGDTGFFFQDRGGGFYMRDNEWIRTYNNKKFYCDNELRGSTVGSDGNIVANNNLYGINHILHGGQVRWIFHRANDGSELTIARSWTENAEDWNWERAILFSSNLGGGHPGICLGGGKTGPWVKGIINGPQDVQFRGRDDTRYARGIAREWAINTSYSIDTRYSPKTFEEVNYTKILKENHIVNYLEETLVKENNEMTLSEEISNNMTKEKVITERQGFLVDMLTAEAQDILVSESNGDPVISLSSMSNILWKVCQEQQTMIEDLKNKLENTLYQIKEKTV